MKLLQTEIDIEPGRPSQQPVKEGQIGAGCAILRLVNETARENAYTVRLKCDNPYWREEWYRITSLPGPIPAAGVVVNARADVRGPQDRWIKTFVPTGGRRDVQISFYAPQTPSSRAGKYRVSVVVETQITNPAAGAGRDARISEIPAIVIVRPYYKWSADISPDGGRRVGFFRRKASLEIVVTSEGNDWLYCDIRTQGQKDVLLEVPAQLVAVPPPAPEVDARSRRSVPLDARTRLRTKRGDPIPQLLPLTPTRIDAPSIAPLPDNRRFDLMSSTGSGAAVIAAPTTDVQSTPGDRILKYHPLIPGTVAGATGWVVQNIKGLVAFALMLVVLIPLAVFFIDATIRQIHIEPLNSETMNGQVTIKGKYVVGGKIFYTVENYPEPGKNTEVPEALEIKSRPAQAGDNTAGDKIQDAAMATNPDIGHIEIPKKYIGRTIALIRAQHDFFIQPLSALLSQQVSGSVTYGIPVPTEDGNRRTVWVDVKPLKPGEPFMINKTAGKPWPTGPNGVTVTVGGNDAGAYLDANGSLWATVPNQVYAVDAQPVQVYPADRGPVDQTQVVLNQTHSGKTVVSEKGESSAQPQAGPIGSGAAPLPQTRVNPQDGAEMILIPAGDFLMGDDDMATIGNLRRKIHLDNYYIYKYPVTVKQYMKFCAATGHAEPPAPSFGWRDDDPVVNVSWNDAGDYCKWVSQGGVAVRLPKEAEWEEAARGTDGLKYPFGDTWDPSKCVNSVPPASASRPGSVYSHPEGSSPFGVMHMAGNVWQWCENTYDSAHDWRVLRGGCYYYNVANAFRSSFREFESPDNRSDTLNIGFRCAAGP